MEILMQDCPSFESCNAPLCPLDPQLKDCIWFADEDICSGRAGSGKRWIKKQRSITKRQTNSYLNRPVSFQELYDNSRPRQMTDEQREALVVRMAKVRAMSNIKGTADRVVGVN